jgi:hypothetical protein
MSKHFITITDENLYNAIIEYCKLNNEKVNDFCQRILKEQLLIIKYGDTPFGDITNVFEIPPVAPIDANAKVEPHIEKVQMPYELEEVTETITNDNGNILEKYKDKEVPKEFYGEIKVEKPEKKKTRRL